MFDFRYHALSLGAVFLALGLGIVLGATLGDQVVSTANRDLRSSLRGEVEKARSNARDASAQVSGAADTACDCFFPGACRRARRLCLPSSNQRLGDKPLHLQYTSWLRAHSVPPRLRSPRTT